MCVAMGLTEITAAEINVSESLQVKGATIRTWNLMF